MNFFIILEFKMLVFINMCSILGLIILLLAFVLSPKKTVSEKMSVYECGFLPFDDGHSTFNIHFFIIAIIFIVFDLEIVFLFPWVKNLASLHKVSFFSMYIFLAILGLGFVYEWKKGALNWAKKI